MIILFPLTFTQLTLLKIIVSSLTSFHHIASTNSIDHIFNYLKYLNLPSLHTNTKTLTHQITMSTENSNPNGAPAEKASRWADNEKASHPSFPLPTSLSITNPPTPQIALLIAVNKSMGGKITWANVEVPAGRTTGSSQKQYEQLLKSTAGVIMTGGDKITPPGSKKRKNPDSEDANGDAGATKAKKPRAPRKKAEPKAGKGGKAKGAAAAKSAANTSASDDEEDFKNEEQGEGSEESGDVVKKEEEVGDGFIDQADMVA